VTPPDEQQPFTLDRLAPPPPRRSRALAVAIVAAAALVAISLAALAYAILNRPASTVAGGAQPSSTSAPPTSPVSAPPSAEPRTLDAAKAAAQHEFDAYAAGDWAGAWDLWTAAGKAAMSRADYVRLHTECKTLTGIVFEITGARLEGESRAVVTWKRSIAAGKTTMLYEGGGWRYQPDAEAMAGYDKGIDKLTADKKAAGDCG